MNIQANKKSLFVKKIFVFVIGFHRFFNLKLGKMIKIWYQYYFDIFACSLTAQFEDANHVNSLSLTGWAVCVIGAFGLKFFI